MLRRTDTQFAGVERSPIHTARLRDTADQGNEKYPGEPGTELRSQITWRRVSPAFIHLLPDK